MLTIVAPGPAALAELWGHLGGHHTQVDIVGDDMSISVDLTDTDPEPHVDVDLVDELAPIEDDDDEEIVEPTPAAVEHIVAQAEVVSIDSKSRERHPAKQDGELTCSEAIVAMLAAEPDATFSIMDIVLALPAFKESTVKFTTAQLTRDGRIARAERGLYRAAS